MKQPHELPANIREEPDTFEIDPGHIHHWLYAGLMPHQRKHILTQEMMTMASIIMTCHCGALSHSWLIPPPEPQADVQRAMTGQDAVDPRIVT